MSKKLWGGRFKKPMDKDFEAFSRSVQYDCKLAEYDVYHSMVHVRALRNSKILSQTETATILAALRQVLRQVKSGTFGPSRDAEDIHTEIQNRLAKKIGSLAQKLHTLRSRNDQVAFDEQWYCYESGMQFYSLLEDLIAGLRQLGERYAKEPFVGYTHMQRAQVILFSDYLQAYAGMFRRDADRMRFFFETTTPTLGAGALAGSSLSRRDYAQAIHEFMKEKKGAKLQPVHSALDQVSDRDFVVEFLGILAIVQMHLSRLSEDCILYATQEFNYFDLPEEFCTGSSLMPHKKNPDFLELVRGYTGRIYGNHAAVLMTMKGLPLSYNRDMQLDKEPMFSSVEIVKDELRIMAKFIRKITLNKKALAQALADERLYATELAEALVRKDVAFEAAHEVVGRVIRYSQDEGVAIRDIPDTTLRSFHAALSRSLVRGVMNWEYAVASKKTMVRQE